MKTRHTKIVNHSQKNHQDNTVQKLRIDRWLWAARFYKTRAKAVNAIKRGRVMVNDKKAKASKMIVINDIVKFRQEQLQFETTVLALSDKRLGAKLARKLYHEPQAIIDAREAKKLEMCAYRQQLIQGKPSKKDRRIQQAAKRSAR